MTSISRNLMDKLDNYDGKIIAVAFEYKGTEDKVGLANQDTGYWIAFARGGRKEVALVLSGCKEELLATLSPEEKEELETVLAASAKAS